MEHPYAAIVTEIRRRITSGELRPGDRVPSTRQITRDWGVAMATATKVLTTLRQQGLVESVRGVGTVVAASVPAGKRREPQGELTRERIARAAIEIADVEGLDAVSMRRIATELGTATMSLYRHVPGKDDLVVLMADTALSEELLPEDPPSGWRAQLELSSRLQWRLYRKHPWAAGVVSLTRPQRLSKAVAHTEWSLRALAGLEPRLRIVAYLAVFGFVRGMAENLEAEAAAQRDTGLSPDEWIRSQEQWMRSIVDSGDFPALVEAFDHDVDVDLDTLFEFGLGRLLDGLAVLLD
ncbi:GntR family transcriptional regulator [Amycolatopsis taiwanensis]|uniref:GntR family transcriptional regulator n=1 Tax=Amycolatopsis taiwanensis TaxID=342230 RepID=A0A9W6R081_9PSEU|nr:GntR family transcriptional regulator [Amycolatopsis taiwanensis]GLY65923.1 GntR family transcriptional regulator [Amycolatopsis taiwanensis]